MSLATSMGPRPNVHFQPWAALPPPPPTPPPPIFFLFGRGIQSITNAYVFTHWSSVVFSLSTDKAYDGRIKKINKRELKRKREDNHSQRVEEIGKEKKKKKATPSGGWAGGAGGLWGVGVV